MSTTRPDVNYLSVDLTNQWTRDAGSAQMHCVDTPTSWNLTGPGLDGTNYMSILKLADGVVFTQKDLIVGQGNECSVDINNHATVDIVGDFGSDTYQGNQLFSVKGGSAARISGVIRGSGNRMKADVLVDNWSDQSYNGSTVDITNLLHVSGRKINIVKRYLSSNVVHGPNARVLIPQSLGLTIYWYVKFIVRKCMKIPLKAHGPSWL